jgi:hypothetical protein
MIDAKVKEAFKALLATEKWANRVQYGRWANKPENAKQKNEFKELVDHVFGKAVQFAESDGKRGGHRNFISADEFNALQAKEGFDTPAKYKAYRARLEKEGDPLLKKLPFDPIGHYATPSLDELE